MNASMAKLDAVAHSPNALSEVETLANADSKGSVIPLFARGWPLLNSLPSP